jgi:tetratricopeptide (TPR) repeat protein
MKERAFYQDIRQMVGSPAPLGRLSLEAARVIGTFAQEYGIQSAVELCPTEGDSQRIPALSDLERLYSAPESPSTHAQPLAFMVTAIESLPMQEMETWLSSLFELSQRFAVLLSSNEDSFKITGWVRQNCPQFVLAGYLPHRYPPSLLDDQECSLGGFYFFSRGESLSDDCRVFRNPDYEDIYLGKSEIWALTAEARALLSKGQPEEATQILGKIVAAAPDEQAIWANLGFLLLNLGQIREAEAVFRSLMAQAPDSRIARMNLAKILLSERRWGDLRSFMPEILTMRRLDNNIDKFFWSDIKKEFLKVEEQLYHSQMGIQAGEGTLYD